MTKNMLDRDPTTIIILRPLKWNTWTRRYHYLDFNALMFSGKILNHTNVPLSVIYMATTCLLSWRSSIEINSSAFLDDWNPSWVAFAEIWWIFAVAVEVWIRQCPSRVPGMVSLTWISFQGKFVLEKCFFRKGEMFYTCKAFVTKVKQLQRCNNLIGYWSLGTC